MFTHALPWYSFRADWNIFVILLCRNSHFRIHCITFCFLYRGQHLSLTVPDILYIIKNVNTYFNSIESQVKCRLWFAVSYSCIVTENIFKDSCHYKSTCVISKVWKCRTRGRVNITHKSLCIGDKKVECPDNPQACKLAMFNLLLILITMISK